MSAFASDEMAAGYAHSRPAVHRHIINRVFQQLGRSEPVNRALDVGCGAGVSMRALEGFAHRVIGIEPAEAMLRWSSATAPAAKFAVATAEAIPLRDRTFDLITAAGSLNYVDLDRFFPEALRVLTPDGVLVVYDFSPGKSFVNDSSLDEWFANFLERYPAPAADARELSPDILAKLNSGFRLECQETFRIALTLAPDFYLRYVLTETNVAAAVRKGIPFEHVRTWCAETLAPVWRGVEREVLFEGYFACMKRS